MKDIQETDRTH